MKKLLTDTRTHDIVIHGSLVKRLRRRPLTAETGVRFPYELLTKVKALLKRLRGAFFDTVGQQLRNGVLKTVWQRRKPMMQQVYPYWKDWRQFGRDRGCILEAFPGKV